jgi:Zn-dependent peptidase ImmA (M78 family)
MSVSARRYPKLPETVQAPGGPVSVTLATSVGDGDDSWGTFEQGTRQIRIDSKAPRRHQWWTLYHELVHVALNDAGLDEMMTGEAQEALCNAIAAARVRERFG